jgi:dsRNA-specific ribonuclease
MFFLIVKEVEYGRGEASTRKLAKEAAAEVALTQLMEEVGEV